MPTIVLIGPVGAGKSTQAEMLAKKLGLPRCCYDEVKSPYRIKAGLDRDKAMAIEKEHGEYALFEYMNEYRSQILEPIFDDYPNHVIDLGGGAHCFNKPEHIERAQRAFDKAAEVILLLPAPDIETCIKNLPGFKEGYAINTFLIMHPTNQYFATKTVYTLDKTPEQTATEILTNLN